MHKSLVQIGDSERKMEGKSLLGYLFFFFVLNGRTFLSKIPIFTTNCL